MKDYIYQFYNEGLATTFYLRPINFVNRIIKNKIIVKVLSFLIRIVYTVLVLMFAWYMFSDKYPL